MAIRSLDGVTCLWGIDASEMKQACADGWAAGLEAKAQLERLVANGSIQCEARGRDRPQKAFRLSNSSWRGSVSDSPAGCAIIALDPMR
jgi:hypothetical protein